jgi:cytoskeletal protein CcmA (bactofilin family)
MEQDLNLRNQDFSFLGKGSVIKGDFTLNGPTKIAAQIEGDLQMHGKSSLTIERSGIFLGNIKCHDLEIFGVFEGSVSSSGKVVIYPPAKITGEIKAKDFIVHPGAILNIKGHTEDL